MLAAKSPVLDSKFHIFNDNYASINKIYDDIFAEYETIQGEKQSKSSLNNCNKLIHETNKILSLLKCSVNAIETMLTQLHNYVDINVKTLSTEIKPDYVYTTPTGMILYDTNKDDFIDAKSFATKLKKSMLPINVTSTNPVYNGTSTTIIPIMPFANTLPANNTTVISGTNICTNVALSPVKPVVNSVNIAGYKMKMPIITELKAAHSMFYYYKPLANDRQYSEGVYCCIHPGVYSKVELFSILDPTKHYEKVRTLKCKFGTKVLCKYNREKKYRYTNEVAECDYAHEGETLVKIGNISKCMNIPNFGDPDQLSSHIKIASKEDMKTILYYTLPDLLAAAIWYDNNKTSIIYNDLSKV